jgi:enoyl-CoA hydratase
MSELVRYEASDGVATVSLDDGKANALSLAMLADINAALDQAEADQNVVVLAGRPGIFSGGFDLKVLRSGGADASRMLQEGFDLSLRLLAFPSPVVVACTGHAVAMASFLLLSADYRVGADGPYKIVANEVAIGMTLPWAAIEICRHRLTPSHFNRTVNLAETFSPDGAVAAGFLDVAVAAGDVRATAVATATHFTLLDRAAHTATKKRSREQAIADIQRGLETDSELFRHMSGEGSTSATAAT